MKSFLTRLISGIILVCLIAGTCWYGGLALGFFVAVVGYIGLDEFYKVFGMSIRRGIGSAGFLGAVLWSAVMLATAGTDRTGGGVQMAGASGSIYAYHGSLCFYLPEV